MGKRTTELMMVKNDRFSDEEMKESELFKAGATQNSFHTDSDSQKVNVRSFEIPVVMYQLYKMLETERSVELSLLRAYMMGAACLWHHQAKYFSLKKKKPEFS